jgi:hypothetical protein
MLEPTYWFIETRLFHKEFLEALAWVTVVIHTEVV